MSMGLNQSFPEHAVEESEGFEGTGERRASRGSKAYVIVPSHDQEPYIPMQLP